MSGGTYAFTGRQFLTFWQFLAAPSKRSPAQRMLLGKVRNRIERILRQEEQEGFKVFQRLNPTFDTVLKDGKPLIGENGKPVRYMEYDPKRISANQGELRIDTLERSALIDFMTDQIEGIEKRDEKNPASGPGADVAGDVLRLASWVGLETELETRLLAAHPVHGYEGKIDPVAVESDDPPPESLE